MVPAASGPGAPATTTCVPSVGTANVVNCTPLFIHRCAPLPASTDHRNGSAPAIPTTNTAPVSTPPMRAPVAEGTGMGVRHFCDWS